jgi:hypothetical protein
MNSTPDFSGYDILALINVVNVDCNFAPARIAIKQNDNFIKINSERFYLYELRFANGETYLGAINVWDGER